jgi:hypothetical protein
MLSGQVIIPRTVSGVALPLTVIGSDEKTRASRGRMNRLAGERRNGNRHHGARHPAGRKARARSNETRPRCDQQGFAEMQGFD